MGRALNNENTDQSKELLSPDYVQTSPHLLEYWASQITEARSIMARALNTSTESQSEGPFTPEYIQDSHLLLEYWVARTAEARARVEERLALAIMNIHMDIALKQSGDAIKRLETALEGSSKTMDSLMHGPWWY
jgi:hypothetical protein